MVSAALAIVYAVLVIIIAIVATETGKSLPTNCPSRGDYPCPDTWTGTDPSAPPVRKCNANFQWDTNGVGPHSCQVTCAPGSFPCWDSASGAGACRPGPNAAGACAAGCTATPGPNACLNGSVCNLTSGACACVGGYAGKHCEIPPAASCSNIVPPGGGPYCLGGKCNPQTGVCDCAPGFWGPRCDPAVARCDLKLCQRGNRLAQCADPNGPTPGNCVCPPGVTPANGPNPCSVCAPGRGPPGDCQYYERTGGTFITQSQSQSPAGCYWRDDTGGHTGDCQAEFGPSASYITYRGNDDHCPGAFDRLYCSIPGKWYTSDASAQSGYNTQATGPDSRGEKNPEGLQIF